MMTKKRSVGEGVTSQNSKDVDLVKDEMVLQVAKKMGPITAEIADQVGKEMDELLKPVVPNNQIIGIASSYPEWAPKVLIESLHRRQNRKHDLFDHEQWITQQCADNNLSIHDRAILLERMYRSRFTLPFDEGNKLIEMLITRTAMQGVWEEIDRRSQSWTDPIDFALECNFAVAGWRGEPKLSKKKRCDLFLEIANTAEQLATLMCKTRELDRFAIADQITDVDIRWLQNRHDAGNSEDDAEVIRYTREQISLVLPSIFKLLSDIKMKSEENSRIAPTVRKPGSTNAEVHYFVRTISEYFRRKYDDPLHPLVTLTMTTIFGDNDYDESYVRSLVSS